MITYRSAGEGMLAIFTYTMDKQPNPPEATAGPAVDDADGVPTQPVASR